MAKTIQIRNVPDDVHRTLRVRAAEAGLSMSEYLLREVTRVASRSDVAEILHRTASQPTGVSHEDVLAAFREMRGRP
jgi:plasmid stability protein